LKEIFDEFKKAKKDHEYNSQKFTTITRDKGERIVSSGKIKAGMIIKLTKDTRVPADMLLLWTSDPNETVFLKTDQLDGETDWKIREPVKDTQNLIKNGSVNSLFDSKCCIQCPQPSSLIYDFNGTYFKEVNSENFEVLRLTNTMWANTVLASGEAVGLV